ncbi:YkgJ family cysteine cluster protein [Brevibacillus choshinensis]|uniref:YkgJ family cysteine cluster protein n=1 Tax=Brevibacillus choshinensis TaxID=54911 RepID=A0ABX7FVV4_BRECH|nr:YkgJ family cysteine cluster protein [Brevibacillus choshinensis]
MDDAQFPCTRCGLCCQHISHIEQLAKFDRGDGVCIHLVDHLCSIYDDRPEICRIDEMYHKAFKTYFTKEQFYYENGKVCRDLQIRYGVTKGE